MLTGKFKWIMVLLLLSSLWCPQLVLAKVDFPPRLQRTDRGAYFNGNENYISVDMHQGVITYLDLTSVVVKQFAPPVYQIACVFFTDQAGQLRYSTATYKYVWSEYDADRVIFKKSYDGSSWQKIPRYECPHVFSGDNLAVQYVWWIAYKTEFWNYAK